MFACSVATSSGKSVSVDYRSLGASGLTVSVVGLGGNNFGYGAGLDAAQTRSVVDAALEEGVTFFDTADIYGRSEEFLGEALKGRRNEVVIATKFGSDMRGANGPAWVERASRRYIRDAVHHSLRALRTDWIDLYQLHWPIRRVPIAETLSALDDLVHEGLVRYVGCSNFESWEIVEAAWTARAGSLQPFVSAQNEYSLANRGVETGLVTVCERYGLGLLPYYPLANGLLTGKYRRGEPIPPGSRLADPEMKSWLSDERLELVEKLLAYAQERTISLLEVAVGGLAAQPAVSSVIAGATSPYQVRENARAASWLPAPEDLVELDSVSGSCRLKA
jgi:aryl-alcohol dehydrogenase-like predicted oxidoreductase